MQKNLERLTECHQIFHFDGKDWVDIDGIPITALCYLGDSLIARSIPQNYGLFFRINDETMTIEIRKPYYEQRVELYIKHIINHK